MFRFTAQALRRAGERPRPSIAEYARSLAASKAGNGDDPSLIEPVAGSCEHDLLLASAGAEVGLGNGFSLAAWFDGEFAENSQKYAGTGRLRYTW